LWRREERWVAHVLVTASLLLAFQVLFVITDLGNYSAEKAVMRWGEQLAGKGEVMKGLPVRDLSNGSLECSVWGLVLFSLFGNVLNNAAENHKMCTYHAGRRGLEAYWRIVRIREISIN